MGMNKKYCLFCDKTNSDEHTILAENDVAYARWDNFPVSKGHVEIVPKSHVESIFDLTDNNLLAMYKLLKEARLVIDKKYQPDAYNIGINDGEAAGRTVHHLHIHLIPRYRGDVDDPKGGVRHIIPSRGAY